MQRFLAAARSVSFFLLSFGGNEQWGNDAKICKREGEGERKRKRERTYAIDAWLPLLSRLPFFFADPMLSAPPFVAIVAIVVVY